MASSQQLIAGRSHSDYGFLVLAGINLFNLVSTARQAANDAAVAEFARNATALAHDLQEERDLASGFAVLRDEPSGQAYGTQQVVVDEALDDYNGSEGGLYDDASALLQARLDAVRGDLSTLVDLRTAVLEGVITRQAAVDEYSAYISDLLDIGCNRERRRRRSDSQSPCA